MVLEEKLQESADYINNIIGNTKIEIAIVLGSGLGGLAEELEQVVYIDYKDIPNFPVSTVPGHKGRLAIGKLEDKSVLCMQGRFHYYEGWALQDCVFPIQVFKTLGIENLLLTNAAGCVNKDWNVGDIMIIKDHIKLYGDSPLRGQNPNSLGDRFFDMGSAWNKDLQYKAKECAKQLGMTIREGVYMMFGGPQFETPAEIKMARILGADSAGMSTVPEAIAASHMRMKTLGLSCMTNMGAGILDQPLNHEEVLETGEKVKHSFTSLVKLIVKKW